LSVKDLIDILPEEYKFKVIDARPGLFDWGRISTEFKLSESFIEKHKNRVDWWHISKYQKLSESFIEKFSDRVDWSNISAY
jgi:hypothetical protein